MMRRTWSLSALTAVLLTFPLLAPSGAGAAPAASTSDLSKQAQATRAAEAATAEATFIRNQEEVRSIADEVQAAVEKENLTGYAGLAMSGDTRTLTVYWKGPQPTVLRSLSSAATQRNLRVLVQTAAFSRRQLETAMAILDRDPTLWDKGMVSYNPRHDGSGMDIGVSDSSRKPTWLPELGVSVFLHDEKSALPLLGRWNDSVPFWGGAVIKNADGAGCSTGFGVRRGNPVNYFMLTALHCRAGNGGLLLTPADLVVGAGYEWDQGSDIMTIDTSYGRSGVTSGNSIWRGSIDKTGRGIGETYTRVGGAKKAIVTEKLCTSGGFSGERCSLKVTATDKVIEGIHNLVEVEHTTRGNAAGQGDSGGPVFAPGSTLVSARGTVVLADGTTQVGCSGDTSGGRQCFWRIYFADIMYALSYFRATINT